MINLKTKAGKIRSKIVKEIKKREYKFAAFPEYDSKLYRIKYYREDLVTKRMIDNHSIEKIIDQMPRKSGIVEAKQVKVVAGVQGFVKNNRIYCEEFYEFRDILNEPRFPVIEFKNHKCVIQEKKNKNDFENESGMICILASRSDNYYHMMVEYIGRLAYILSFEEYKEKDILVTKEFYSVGINKEAFDYIRELAGHKGKVYVLEVGTSVKVKRIIYPIGHVIYPQALKPNGAGYYERTWQNPVGLLSIRNVINSSAQFDAKYSKKLYISRSNIKGRERVSNNKEIESLLVEKGFSIVQPEEYSFKEQIMLFRTAKAVVLCSGASVANVVFCAPGTEVILFNDYDETHCWLFPSYALDLGLKVKTVPMKLETGNDSKCGNEFYRVNINTLKELL